MTKGREAAYALAPPRHRKLSALNSSFRSSILAARKSATFSIWFFEITMSALVGYGSSSEDEDDYAGNQSTLSSAALQKPQAVSTTNSQSNEEVSSSDFRVGNVEQSEEPMIGPTIPDAFDQTSEAESAPVILQSMSERDALRFLTQASHPTTSLPPSPPGSPDPAVTSKIKRFLDLKDKGIHFNEDLAGKTNFKNPSLFSTMISRFGIEGAEQYCSSLPTSMWDPTALPSFAYKEELLRSQQSIRDQETENKKKLMAAGKRTIDFMPTTDSGYSITRGAADSFSKRKKA